jgi:hypothetical protein
MPLLVAEQFSIVDTSTFIRYHWEAERLVGNGAMGGSVRQGTSCAPRG